MPHVIGVRNVGPPANNHAALKAFYQDVLGMRVVRETSQETSAARPCCVQEKASHENHRA